MLYWKNVCSRTLKILTLLGLLGTYSLASAAQTTLTWKDSSTNEDGFRIERRIGTSGTYQQLTSVAANTTIYTDRNLSNGTSYCYRVRAFNSAGNSGYSNENCATTQAATFTVAVSRAGSGGGTVSSSPAGIYCSSDCTENYPSGTVITLTATPASGSVFAGWSGSADCVDGRVTVNANLNCTATFNLVSGYTLTTSIVKEITASGSPSGKVVSNPAGIDCGSDCTQTYTAGKVITLTPVPAANSKFAGWTGNADCSDGSITLNAAKTCTAKFSLNAMALSVAKSGEGTVTSAPTGIACGTSCTYSFATGTTVTLRATPAAGSIFSGWSGVCTGKPDCTVTLSSATTVTANFSKNLADRIGIYRPSTGEWFLDRNGSGTWEGCSADICVKPLTDSKARPVVGDWNGSGTTKTGLFLSDSSQWILDDNGNGTFDGCEVDICAHFGRATERATDMAVIGQWSADPSESIGIFRPAENRWLIDANGDSNWDGCTIDLCVTLSVYRKGDVAVAGDWAGRGTSQLGFFRPSTGQWFIYLYGNRSWDGCAKELCVASFGASGDVPVSGDWNGTGITKIGVYRPSTGEWFLDLNGNGQWDGSGLDLHITQYGRAGDLPVVGRW